MANSWRGIFVIVATPFTEDLELDEASLRREINYLVDAGVHGLVGPAFASEFAVLSDDERKRWIQIVVEESGGRLPVVATTHAVHTLPAIELSRFAQDVGADAIMIMPPHIVHLDAEGCFEHYRSLSDALDIPIVVQNMIGPVGTPMSGALLARICRELENVRYIKEERLPQPISISEVIETVDEGCDGVFGGRGGLYIIDEHRRGACGNMPGVSIPTLHVAIWERLEEGDEAGARTLYNRVLPLFTTEGVYGPVLYKEMLRRRGIFSTNRVRVPRAGFEGANRAEFEIILDDLAPLLDVE